MSANDKSVTRYKTIDALRGLAALGVVFFHLSGHLKDELTGTLPQFVLTGFSFGFLGVPIFFVISGFVISMSLRNAQITPAYAGRFILRRSIRLDPTYWAAIFLAVGLLFVKNKMPGMAEPIPSVGVVLAHMFYLQDLLSVSPIISVVYWTLCLEVQLYLFYMFSLWTAQFLARKTQTDLVYSLNLIIIGVGIYSVALDLQLTRLNVPGLFLSSWHYFLMGCLVSNVVAGEKYSRVLLAIWLLFETTAQLAVHAKAYTIGGISVSLLIVAFWRWRLLENGLQNAVLQYLGRISYTLYLTHPDIGWKAISVAKLLVAKFPFPGSGLIMLAFGLAVSIAVAHFFHIAFERPSLILCSKLRKKPAAKTQEQPLYTASNSAQ